MRAILVGGLVLLMTLLWADGPASAVPLAPERPDAATSSPLLLAIRHHHRHHHRHWRHGHSRGWDDGAPEAYPPGIEGQSVPAPTYSDSGAGSTTAPAPGSASRPSIRWVNPGRSMR